MNLFIATLALVVCQDPQPPVKTLADEVKKDVITLKGGETIVGTILKQVGNYIEVRLDANTVVGFERSRISSIAAVVDVAAKKPGLTPRDEWFLLHDARGHSAGYMHELVQPVPEGGVRVSEEWYFTTKSGRTQVTMIDTLDAALRPKSTFYHERVMSKRDRLVSEHLLSAEVKGSKLVVEKRSLKGRDRHEYPFDARTQFPLSYRAKIRQAADTQLVDVNQVLFDARTGEFLVWKASSVARRKIELNGRRLSVREITLDNGVGSNSEWIDANHRVVRREVNGASLVAVRVEEGRARRAIVTTGPTGYDPAIVATSSGDMAVWLPNPIWTPSSKGASRVSIKAPLYSATATLMILDQVPENVGLASAADILVRWLKLSIGNDLKVRKRDGMQVQRSPAIRLKTEWSIEREGESKPWKGVCHVFQVRGKYAALFCASPRESFGELEQDFRRILSSVQLDRQDVVPNLQGPKAKATR